MRLSNKKKNTTTTKTTTRQQKKSYQGNSGHPRHGEASAELAAGYMWITPVAKITPAPKALSTKNGALFLSKARHLCSSSGRNIPSADPTAMMKMAATRRSSAARGREEEEGKPKNAENFPFGKHEEPRELPRRAETEVDVSEEDTEDVGEQRPPQREEQDGPMEGDEPDGLEKSDEVYHYALHIATTPGMGKADLKREQNRLITDFKRRVEFAFKLAAAQAAEEGFATFSSVKPGMKSLSFSDMPVSSITEIAYGPKRKPYARIVLFDGKREMALLVPRERAGGITQNDRIAPKKVAADFIVEKSEVVLLAGPKSNVVVYK